VSDWYVGSEHQIETLWFNGDRIDLPEPSAAEDGLGASLSISSLLVNSTDNSRWAPLDPWTALHAALPLGPGREVGLPGLPQETQDHSHLAMAALASRDDLPTWRRGQPMQMLR